MSAARFAVSIVGQSRLEALRLRHSLRIITAADAETAREIAQVQFRDKSPDFDIISSQVEGGRR